MENTYKELKTDMELLTAALLQAHVYVVATPQYDPDEPLDYGGLIEAYSPIFVQIDGMKYMRKYHSFRLEI